METGRVGRREREYLVHREEILSAAEKVFAAKGFFLTTMSDIAREAEFGTGTLYKYFRSKEELYFTLIDEKVEEINRLVKDELSQEASAVERIKKVLGLQFEFFERNRDFFRIYISERNRFEWTVKEELGKDLHEKMVTYINILAEVMRQGIERKEFRSMNPMDLAHALVGIVNSFVFEWMISPETLSARFKGGYGFRNLFRRRAANRKEESRSMRMKCVIGFILWTIVSTSAVWAQESQAPLTLEESIKIAMERSLTVHSAVMGVEGSEFRRKEAITNFLPLWTGQYNYTK